MPEDDQKATTQLENRSTGERVAEDLRSFTGLTSDFYRGEIDRATTWRGRLDQTTNWAVVIVAAILTWAFSGDNRPHYVILIGVFGVTAFLVMEAHRYREYDVWRSRVRTLQADLIAEAFAPGETSNVDWRRDLSEDLRAPSYGISHLRALNHRLRRSYLALLLILLLAWGTRVTVYEPNEPWRQTASILMIPGEVVVACLALFYAVLIALTLWSARGTRTVGFKEGRENT